MYKVLLVDDEAPALRFLQAIVTKYAPDFEIAASCTNAQDALAFLQAHRVDLLMTDISMPGMDGINLSMEARHLCPSLCIVIVSGYADFEYAQGAIQAAVDDYILKPVTIPHMTATLDKIKAKLDKARAAQEPALLAALLTGQMYDAELLRQFYGEGQYHFAYLRWGNLMHFNEEPLSAATPLMEQGLSFHVLQGRNAEEQVLYARADIAAADFQNAAKGYIAQARSAFTWNLIFGKNPLPFSQFPDFVHRAEKLHRSSVVIGRHQYMFLTPAPREEEPPHLSSATIKKLEYFCESGNKRLVKDLLFTLAADWEKRQVPQVHAYRMVQQLLHTVLPYNQALARNQDGVNLEIRELMGCAAHYGDLMVGVYTLLFDEALATDKRMSPEELYQCALSFIQEKYGEPISVTHVCSEIGISQTYLNRLFRKFGNTSFNACLTQCRMEGAMKLIREHPTMRLRDVAACVGYEDSSYFSKVFHQTTGQTPSQWAASFTDAASDLEEPES